MTPQLQTNSTGGLFGGLGQLLGSAIQTVGNVVQTALPTAAELYKLKLQGDAAQNQATAASLAAQQQANTSSAPNPYPAWIGWALGGLVLVFAVILFRRR